MKLREEEFYNQYHQHGGTTIIPTEIFNELYDDATEEIERLNGIIEIKTNRIQDLMKRLSKRTEKVERLNNIIKEAIEWFDNADRRGLNELLDILKGSAKE